MKRAMTFAAGVLLLVAGVAWAQPGVPTGVLPGTAAEPSEAPPPVVPEREVLEVADVMARAAEMERELRQLEATAAPVPAIETIIELSPAARERLEERVTGVHERIEAATHTRALRDIDANWRRESHQFGLWNTALTERVRTLENGIKRFSEIEEQWLRTRSEFTADRAPPAVQERIETALSSLANPRRNVTGRRDDLLAVQAEIAGDLDKIEGILALVADAEKQRRSSIFGADAPPIWDAVSQERNRDLVIEHEKEAFLRNIAGVRAYLGDRRDRVLIHVLVIIFAFFVLRYLKGVALRWPEDDESIRASAAVLARPFAGALLVAYSLSWTIYPAAPFLLLDLLGLIGLVPLVRLLPLVLHRSEHGFVYALVAIYIIDIVRELITPLATLERLVFMGEMLATAVILARAMRPVRIEHLPVRGGLLPFTGAAIRLAIALLVVAAGADALGRTAFALVLGEGVLTSTFVALVLYGVYRVNDGVVEVLLRSPVASRLNMVRGHRVQITRRILRILRAVLVLVWVYITADGFAVWNWMVESVTSALSAEVAVGDLVFSPGGIVTFFLVFIVALNFSRLLRFTLEQDVLPRMRLPRGVPYAITATLHYGILVVAMIAALAALLFERPIQTNDVIEVGTLLGTVRRIGIRSSTLRTLDGAEVIVPNATLVSDTVVNWTLSDRQRRIETSVGVKYGTDPERVIELLLQVARDDDRILEHPAPDALFVGFGDSSLDFSLRAWTGRYGEWIQIRSDLNVAVNRALAEAGIEIPFPQRDLHLRSVAAEAGSALARSDEES
ncbi:MAG: mechanosensitive ion channel [Deltaproteobacteria bacterium]|nr:mechanosensitive ion channel [Deltaproteobacteria bacterium]